jgi:AcrR family transcriptional regulator
MVGEVSTRRQQTRDRLMIAATELFAEKSVQASSVEEICERAGFTRGAFYSNFDSKDELCLELVRKRAGQLLVSTRAALATIPDAVVTEHTLAEVLATVLVVLDAGIALDDNWVLVRNELRLYAHRNPRFRPAMLAAERTATALAVEAIVEALERQHAEVLVPVDQLMMILDAYCERTRMDDILAERPDPGHRWRQGLEHILRALVVLPKDLKID